MTLPVERTRSLRWMWEFLIELKTANNLPAQAIAQVESILEHYPTPAQLQEWARHDCANPEPLFGPYLEPENMKPETAQALPQDYDVKPTSAEQREGALSDAYKLVRFTLPDLGCLTDAQKHTKLYVLRHYPDAADIGIMARRANPK